MTTGALMLRLDSTALTTLAQLGARQTHEKWPPPFSGIAPDTIRVHVQAGERLEVSAKGVPSVVLHPTVEPPAALKLKIHIGPVGVPGFLGGIVSRQLNELLAHWRATLAAQGLVVNLVNIQSEVDLLTINAQLVGGGQ